MSEWVVTVDLGGEDPHYDAEVPDAWDDAAEELLELLQENFEGPAVAYNTHGVSVTVTVRTGGAYDIDEAVHIATHAVHDLVIKAGFNELPVDRVEAFPPWLAERRLNEPNMPALLGVAELASYLGVSKQRASELARSAKFPQPAVTLASGPVWLETQVMRYVSDWERRPGRPSSAR
jgi:hypothetical protein